jgi:4-amino-4-deoxy-L-arabinose transferase-like glycosyltransferase
MIPLVPDARIRPLLAALILLLAFFAATYALDCESLWADEGWSLWAVHGDPLTTLERVGNDVHPPLYFVLLDGWTALAGESIYAVRLLSTLCALIALAGTYALTRTLFDRWTGLIALAMLSTSGFVVVYAREARMYTLLLALTVLAARAYVIWQRHPTRRSAVILAVLLAGLLYTHYNGAWIVLSFGLHALITHPRLWRRWLTVAGLAILCYAPWLPVLVHQMQTHPAGLWATAAPLNGPTISWLITLLTTGQWLPLLIALVTGHALPRLIRQRSTFALLLIWLLLSPVIVFAVNAWGRPFYQPRYLIAILPALVIGAAYALRCTIWKPLAVGLLIWIVAGQWLMIDYLWPAKPHWKASITALIAARAPSEPLVTLIDPVSVEAYYDRWYHFRRGRVIDFSPRPPDPATARAVVAPLAADPVVWAVLPNTTFITWDVLALLDSTRHLTYRDWVDKLVIYRFEPGDSADLRYHFGDLVDYEGKLGLQIDARPGDLVCAAISLRARAPLAGWHSISLQLLDARRTLVAQHDEGIGVRAAGELFPWSPCLTIPASSLPGSYRLVLVVYNWTTLEPLRVIEGEGDSGFDWGDLLVLGTVGIAR